jgi:hypothetical protein
MIGPKEKLEASEHAPGREVEAVPSRPNGAGEIYIFKGSMEEPLQLFQSRLEAGWNGLFISGRSTDEIQKVKGLRSVPTFQITRDANSPNAIWSYSGLSILVTSIMRVREKSLVLIDKLEELERSPEKGNFPVFIEDLRREVEELNALVIIHMDTIENKWVDTIGKHYKIS